MNTIQPEDKIIKCLDKGFVRLVDHMGSDQRIVDAARVSYQTGTTKVQDDRNLIRYMLRNAHWTPFEKVVFEFHIKCPMFIGEQWLRHRMGSFNKISGRYSEMKDEFYVADPLRKQSTTNKQGSSVETVDRIRWPEHEGPEPGSEYDTASQFIQSSHACAYKDYELMLEAGVAKELARGILPANLYTEFYWTVNLRSLFNFLELRLDSHAQYEIQVFAQAVFNLIKEHVDIQAAVEAFQDYVLDDPKLTKYEINIIKQALFDADSNPNSYGRNLKQHVESLIQNNLKMSKREKTESKLITLLGLNND